MQYSQLSLAPAKAQELKRHLRADVGQPSRLIGRTTGDMHTKLLPVCDSQGRPFNHSVTAGQISDYIGARALLSTLPNVEWLLGSSDHDADWVQDASKDKEMHACISGSKQHKASVKHGKRS